MEKEVGYAEQMEQGTNWGAIAYLFSLAIPFGWDAMKEVGWRRNVAAILAGVFVLSALFWTVIETHLPVIAEIVSDLASNPQAWFTLFALIAAIFIFTGPQFKRIKTTAPTVFGQIATVAELESKSPEHWNIGSEMMGQIDSMANQISGIEQKLFDLQIGKLATVEAMLRPRIKGETLSLLNTPEKSRLDQLAEDISEINKGLVALGERISREYRQQQSLSVSISNAIRARYTLEEAIESDRTILRLTPRLLSAHKDTYATEATWLSEYQEWERAMSAIDRIINGWGHSFGTFLDLDRSHYLEMDGTLPIESAITTAMTNRWQTVSLVDQQYKAKREKLLQYLDLKSWELPR
tara:strand:+ start:43508 stop:44563 length:1056 start_codon:yes stop_codon:yes gene_type:complete